MAGNSPRRLDEALRPGGLTYTASGVAIDANGNPLEGAPERPADTKPEDQPHARMAAQSSAGFGVPSGSGGMDFEAIGRGIAAGLSQAATRGEAEEQSRKAHDEVRSGAEGAKPSGRPALVPGSATAEIGTGVPRTDAERDARDAAIASAPESGVSGVTTLDAARGVTEAQAAAAREAAAKATADDDAK